MVCLRIIAASAVLFIGIGAAAAETGAASAPGSAPGTPISLLPSAQAAKTAAKVHVKSAPKIARKVDHKAHRTVAAAKPTHLAAHAPKAADATPSAAAWPKLAAMPVTDAATSASAVPPAPADPQLSEMVVDGRTVHIASPDDVNELDLAAAKTGDALATAAKSEPAVSPPMDATAAAASTDESPISDSSWYMQAFAALGGAVAAGSIAWFLMGSAPHRMYG